MSIKVSVIVPVYNGGDYLAPCIQSIVSQTLKEIEIILVDDGSTDNSLTVLQSFAERDKRITVLHQENKGGNSAWLAGMKQAKGEYLYFADDDDLLFPDALKGLYEAAIGADVVKGIAFGRSEEWTEDRMLMSWPNWWNAETVRQDEMTPQRRKQFFNVAPETWTMIYAKEFLDKNNIRPANVSFFDTDFAFKVRACAKTFRYIPVPVYLWNIHQGSVSHSARDPFDVVFSFDDLERFLKANKVEGLWDMVGLERLRVYGWNLNRIKDTDEEIRNTFLVMMQRDIRRDTIKRDLLSAEQLVMFEMFGGTPT